MEAFMKQHKGKENAVTSKEIKSAFGCKGSKVRSTVNEMRRNGIPICSCSKGYYYAENDRDISETIAHLDGRIQKIKEARDGLRNLIHKNK